MVQYLNVDTEPQISEARRAELEAGFLALIRGELTSPALSEKALLKKGGNSIFSSLEAGDESITKDLLEALDKAAKLCTKLAPGENTIFAEARSQLCQLLGRKAVSHANVAKYLRNVFAQYPWKKFRSGALLLKPRLVSSYMLGPDARREFDQVVENARIGGDVQQYLAAAGLGQQSSVPVPSPIIQPLAFTGVAAALPQVAAPPEVALTARAQKRKLKKLAAQQAAGAAKMPTCHHVGAGMPAGIYCPQCVGAAMQAQQPAQPLAPQCVPVAPQGPSAPAVAPPAAALPAPAPAVAPPRVFVPIPPEFAVQVPNGRVIDARTHTVYIAPVQPPTPFVGKVDAATMKAWSGANDGRCWNLFHRGFCSRPNHHRRAVSSTRDVAWLA